MKFEIYIDVDKQHRWRLKSLNGKVIANSGEGYHNYQDMIKSINLVRSTNEETPIVNIT